MEITDVQVKLVGDGDERLKASCTIAIDGEFVVRDVKVIEGTSGLFVAMPSRKLTDHCPKCGYKNHLRSRYCNHCGAKLADNRWPQRGGATQLHAEIAHPINRECREHLHKRVIEAYEAARQEQGQPTRGAEDTPAVEPAPIAKDAPILDEPPRDDLAETERTAEQPDVETPADSSSDSHVSPAAEPEQEGGFGAGLV